MDNGDTNGRNYKMETNSMDFQSRASDEIIAREMLQSLKTRNEELEAVKDLLVSSVRDWVRNLSENVKIVRTQIQNTRDMTFPTCSLIEKLSCGEKQHEELSVLMTSVLDKVDHMAKQIPIATCVIGTALDKLNQASPGTPSTVVEDEPEIQSKFTTTLEDDNKIYVKDPLFDETDHDDDSECHDHDDNLECHAQDDNLECHDHDFTMYRQVNGKPNFDFSEQKKHQCMNNLIGNLSNDNHLLKINKEINPVFESQTESNEIQENIFKVLKNKDNELDCYKNSLINTIQIGIRDISQKMFMVTSEFNDAETQLYHTINVMRESKCSHAIKGEIQDIANSVKMTMEHAAREVQLSDFIIESAIQEVGPVKWMEQFRDEITAAIPVNLPKYSGKRMMPGHILQGASAQVDDTNSSRDGSEEDNGTECVSIQGNVKDDVNTSSITEEDVNIESTTRMSGE